MRDRPSRRRRRRARARDRTRRCSRAAAGSRAPCARTRPRADSRAKQNGSPCETIARERSLLVGDARGPAVARDSRRRESRCSARRARAGRSARAPARRRRAARSASRRAGCRARRRSCRRSGRSPSTALARRPRRRTPRPRSFRERSTAWQIITAAGFLLTSFMIYDLLGRSLYLTLMGLSGITIGAVLLAASLVRLRLTAAA